MDQTGMTYTTRDDRIKELYEYDPSTGTITNKKTGKNTWYKRHYYQVGGFVALHRLAFFLMKGRWPVGVDHINRNKLDNRWCNLREADKSVNERNTGPRKTNTSGHIGVSWHRPRKKWRAYINVGPAGTQTQIHLGLYDTLEGAVEARKLAEEKYWT